MLILLDMDGVLSNFDQGVVDEWNRRHPGDHLKPYRHRREFYIDDDHPEHMRPRIQDIYTEPGFFLRLKPIHGSQQAVRDMLRLGLHIGICTAPLFRSPSCLDEKFRWTREHFGEEVARTVIITKDKTRVRGDVLIDDNPDITGFLAPVWEHVLFDHPYNRQVNGKRRLTWANWQQVLKL